MADFDYEEEFRNGVKATTKSQLITIAGAVGGISVTAALVAGGVWPLFAAYVAHTISYTDLIDFLKSTGGNAIASWFQNLGETGIKNFLRRNEEGKQDIAKSINQQIVTNEDFYSNAQNLLQRFESIDIALQSLDGKADEQLQLVTKISIDLQQLTRTHAILHRRLFEQTQRELKRLVSQNEQLLSQNNSMKTDVETLQHLFELFLKHAKTPANPQFKFNDVKRVVVADVYQEAQQTIPHFNVENNYGSIVQGNTYNGPVHHGDVHGNVYHGPVTINNQPVITRDPDAPLDVLDALFPYRGRIN